jgi:hypothetical protein
MSLEGHFRRIQPVLAAGRLPLGPKSGPHLLSRRQLIVSARIAPRQVQLVSSVPKLFNDLGWISRLRAVYERVCVHLDAGELRFIRWTGHGYYSGPITVGDEDGNGGSACLDT